VDGVVEEEAGEERKGWWRKRRKEGIGTWSGEMAGIERASASADGREITGIIAILDTTGLRRENSTTCFQ